MKEREQFKSRIGFILLSAGCAIGIGNVWRFPYVVGESIRKNKSKMAFTWLYVFTRKYLFNDFLYDSFRMDVKIFL